MLSLETLNGVLSSALVVLTSIAIQFRNASKAQRRALKDLRDRDIKWALYVHDLRVMYAADTGKEPPNLPDSLLFQYNAEI